MKKKNDLARECAERLKPFGKTIKEATDFYIRHLTRKKSTGRPKGTGRFSGILPDMDFADLRKRFDGDQFTTRVLDLFEIAMRQRPARPKHLAADQQRPQTTDALRAARRAEQKAMSDADREQRMQKRDVAAKAYEHFLEHTPVPADLEGDERKQEIQKRFAKFLLTPAGKFTDAMADDIYNELTSA